MRQGAMKSSHFEKLTEGLTCGLQGFVCQKPVHNGHVMRHCPAHDDEHPSLSLKQDKDKVLWKCLAGCTQEEVLATFKELGLMGTAHRTGHKIEGGTYIPPRTTATVQPCGCTVAQYAEAKQLPIEFLRGLGLQDISY